MTILRLCDSEISKHRIFKTLNYISQDLNYISERGFKAIADREQLELFEENYKRIEYVLQYVQKMILNSEPNLFTMEFLDGLNYDLSDIATELKSCMDFTDDLEKYISLNNKIDGLINKNSFMFFGMSSGYYNRNNELYRDMHDMKKIIDLQSRQKERLDHAIDKFKNESSSVMLEYTKTINSVINDLDNEKTEIIKASGVFFDKYKSELEKLKKQAEEIVGIIGSIGLSSNYKIEANRAGRFTIIWQAMTIFFLIGLANLGYQVGEMVIEPNVGLIQVMPKMIIISIGALIIKYTASQVRYYQEREAKSRKIELELASLDPFIAVLKADEQQSLKAKLAENYFIGSKSTVEKQENSINISHWLKELFDACCSFNKTKS